MEIEKKTTGDEGEEKKDYIVYDLHPQDVFIKYEFKFGITDQQEEKK